MADYLGLKDKDVVIEANAVRTLRVDDLMRAIRSKEEYNRVIYSREGRKRTIEIATTRSERVALILSQDQIDDPDSELPPVVRAAGLQVDIMASLPPKLSKYAAIVIASEKAAKPGVNDAIRSYLRTGGGVVLIDQIPIYLCGDVYDRDREYQWRLEKISEWFGASRITVTGGYYVRESELTIGQNKPIGTTFSNGQRLFSFTGKLDYFGINELNMNDTAVPMAWWSNFTGNGGGGGFGGRDGRHCGIFYQRYGEGRVYYQFKATMPSYPRLQELFVAGVRWAANVGT
ncbi:MAG: hypothetical protein M5U21_06245 [Fimbriimonadaceae bacterium]|nr:hypothetical protein [Fimbriimonadaceae bacterium]